MFRIETKLITLFSVSIVLISSFLVLFFILTAPNLLSASVIFVITYLVSAIFDFFFYFSQQDLKEFDVIPHYFC